MAARGAIQVEIEHLYQGDWAKLLATLVRQTRDLDTAEDALQEAIARAIVSWPESGIPANPAGWVSTTAQRIAVDIARRNSTFQGKMPQLVIPQEPDLALHAVDLAFGDDRLRLIFTCCHPILSPESRLALTLRMICGLSTSEIAALFLVQESTMAARITRAKSKLTSSGVPYQIPAPEELEHRLHDVLAVVYLVATSAHTPGSGIGLHDTTHMKLALDLTRVLLDLIPDHPEVMSMRALVLLAEARKDSRIDAAGNALPLEHMDRSLWDSELIAKAQRLVKRSMLISQPDTVGSYTIQAAIAMVHAEATSYDETDWAQIASLYAVLNHKYPGSIVRLGYAIAVGMRDGAEAGLKMIEQSGLEAALPNYPMLAAAKADLNRRIGNRSAAAFHYRRAAKLTGNTTLMQWFLVQAVEMESRTSSS